MCVILLQIHEIIIFDFCELYHEIKKQDIFEWVSWFTQLPSRSINIYQSNELTWVKIYGS